MAIKNETSIIYLFFFPRFSLHYTILFPLLIFSQLDLKFHILAIEFSLNYGLIFVKIN
jgi:hypothetical protein